MSSSLSTSVATSTKQWKYDVFLNFRGGDVRDKFLSHLREALVRSKLVTFFDEDLRRGEEISPALLKAIEESHVAVTIFSKDYASSPWCLEELTKIIECYHYRGQIVIPVFYDVISSVVLEQSGIYAEAFAKHERDRENARKVPKWKAAMTKAANLSGRSARNSRPESKLVNEIVNDILISLGRTTDGVDDTVETGSGLQKSWSVKLSNTRTLEVQGTGDLPLNKSGTLPIENLVSLSEPLQTSDVEITTRQRNLLRSVKMQSFGSSPNTTVLNPGTQNHLSMASPQSLEDSNADSSHKRASALRTLGYSGLGNSNPDSSNKPASQLGSVESSGQGNFNANSSYRPSLGTMGSSELENYSRTYGLGTIGSTGLGNLNRAYGLGTTGSNGLGNHNPAYGLGTIGSTGLGNYNPAYGLGTIGSSGPAYGLGSGATGQSNAASASTSIHISSTFTYCGCDMCKMSFRP